MSQEPPAKRLRKGAKSCLECRHRKVRCVWSSEGAEACDNCSIRGRTCELQVSVIPTSEAIKVTSRARIGHLESDVSNLWTAVHNLEAKLGCEPTKTAPRQQPSPQTEDAPQDKPSDDNYDSDSSDFSPANPPTHLLQLFDNGLLGNYGDGEPTTAARQASSLHNTRGRSALKRLMPSREDMLTIKAHASSWLTLYNALFPMSKGPKSSDEMLSQYDNLQHADADPIAIASLLLSIAVTVQQAPHETAGGSSKSIRNATSYVKDVSDAVERIVIYNDALAGSFAGIETTLLFLRLQLGRARIRKIWLISRRVIALAELNGLPRALLTLESNRASTIGTAHDVDLEIQSSLLNQLREKADAWEAICAVDRIISMMFSLPLATANRPLPQRPIVDSKGQVISQSYIYRLADIATRLPELDNIYSSKRPLTELLDAVISTDQELRSLASSVPKSWWRIHWPELSIDALLQFWHQYITVRTHLQLALACDEGQKFPFNFITCLDTSQDLARRYASFRLALPAGFFANRVMDMQAFTGAVFLLLASYRTTNGFGIFPQAVDVDLTKGLMDQVVQTMEAAADRPAGDFAKQAAQAIRSLSSLLQQHQATESQKITLNLPLVGKIHVSRKSHAASSAPRQSNSAPDYPMLGTNLAGSSESSSGYPPVTPLGSSDLDFPDSLSYSIEVPENYPFFTDEEIFGTQQWLTWTR